jgi:hypothetical protein
MPFSGVGISFFTYGSLRHLVGHLGWGISPAPRPLPTQDNTTQRNTDTHPCPEQDSNLQSQCSSGRRQYLPQTARLLRGITIIHRYKMLSFVLHGFETWPLIWAEGVVGREAEENV